jgi:hypothetical protein
MPILSPYCFNLHTTIINGIVTKHSVPAKRIDLFLKLKKYICTLFFSPDAPGHLKNRRVLRGGHLETRGGIWRFVELNNQSLQNKRLHNVDTVERGASEESGASGGPSSFGGGISIQNRVSCSCVNCDTQYRRTLRLGFFKKTHTVCIFTLHSHCT